MRSCFLGIDVGGSKKGFHIAVVPTHEPRVAHLSQALNPEELIREIERLHLNPLVIAIDCPPQSTRSGLTTRLAERQLHRKGYRVQWTRHKSQGGAEWMQNGEHLWQSLRNRYDNANLIECFPTIAGEALATSKLVLPLALLSPLRQRREWKDLVDACICADVASRFHRGEAHSVGFDEQTGERDELGPIYY